MDRIRRNVFLVDGLGALASTASPLLVVPALEPWLGLPLGVTWVLAVPAALLAVYGLLAWLRSASVVPWLLPTLAGNVAFCAFLPLYLSQHLGLLTPLGMAWFAGELGILAAVVAFEVTVLRRALRAS
ncbi:MAG: hypothetical protein H6734_24725 [Alphaproteobacteria bacterium]|nr:hypothetical protein [Alphaproteobacteria bacterium]